MSRVGLGLLAAALLLGSAVALFSWLAASPDAPERGGARPASSRYDAPVAGKSSAELAAPPEGERSAPASARDAAEPQGGGPPDADGRRAVAAEKRAPAATRQTLVGQVVGDEGPVPGAQVQWTDSNGVALCEATSDPRGSFELAVPRPLENGLILVRARGFAPLETGPHPIRAGERRFVGNLRLMRGVPLAGKVVAPGGFAIAGARVQLRAGGPSGGFNRYVQEAEAAADGGFRFPEAPSGTLKVEAFAPGYGSRALEVLHDSARDSVTVQLAPAHVLHVVLRDTKGAPVPGAKIRLRPHDPNSPELERVSDAKGVSLSADLGSEIWEVRVEAAGFRPAVRDGMVADGNPVEIELAPWPCIAGRVVAPSGAELPAGVTVLPLSANARGGFADSGLYEETPVSPDGAFRICDLRPGLYIVRARAPGYAPSSSAAVRLTLGGDAENVAIELRSGGRLSLSVRSKGAPMSSVRVELYSAQPPPGELFRTASTPLLPPQTRAIAEAPTGADGEVVFEHLAEGQHWCIVRPVGLLPKLVGPITVVDGTLERAGPVDVEEGGRLAGTVQGSAGEPLQGAIVHIFGEAELVRAPVQVETNAEGEWTSPLLPPGAYRITARKLPTAGAALGSATAEAAVERGKERVVPLRLE